jgi:hypothetical protein
MQDFLKITTKRVIASLIAAILYDLISQQVYSEDPPFGFLSNPLPRVLLIFIVSFTLLSLVISYVKKRRRKLVGDNAPSVYVAKGRPKHIEEAVSLEKWGVEWRGVYGRKSRRSEPYVHVEGPFCPYDDTELTRRKVHRWILFTRRVWVCPRCEREYARPIRHLYNESEEVRKIMESDIKNDRVINDKDG